MDEGFRRFRHVLVIKIETTTPTKLAVSRFHHPALGEHSTNPLTSSGRSTTSKIQRKVSMTQQRKSVPENPPSTQILTRWETRSRSSSRLARSCLAPSRSCTSALCDRPPLALSNHLAQTSTGSPWLSGSPPWLSTAPGRSGPHSRLIQWSWYNRWVQEGDEVVGYCCTTYIGTLPEELLILSTVSLNQISKNPTEVRAKFSYLSLA